MPFGFVSAWNKRRRNKSQDHVDPWVYKPMEYWQLEDHSPSARRHHGSSVFTLKEMEEATCSFSDENLVGKGGFGRVYRGTLRSGEVVAIKKMEMPPFKAAEGEREREFRVEVDILSRLDHPNLVTLIGYCADGKQRFLVYEFMHKGNLQDHLNGIGEISDFGLAKMMPENQEMYVTTKVLGTFGYFDPEYTSTGKLTIQSDVYAFGVVLLELLTGRRAVDLSQGPNDQNLVLQVRHILTDRKKLRKVIDPDMNRSSYNIESIAMFANLASRCVRAESTERPSMTDCVKELQMTFLANARALGGGMLSFKTA
ncbi:hypothetical protein Syun_023999 [Stephania yunnanensis]|uniref:Protein kinase domain-containing protein n=1 Tax=Stephania yunnanensis TaxID=152371 RepID=A0AAP0FIV7_9MAGN